MLWVVLLCFVLGVVVESLTAIYIRATTSQRPRLASLLSGAIDALSLLVIAEVVLNKSLFFGAAWVLGRMIGSYCGTSVNMKDKIIIR